MKTRLLLLLAGVALIGIVYLVGWSSLLSVSSVSIETKDPKNVVLIESQLQRSGQVIEVGQPLARINTRAIERALKDQPWIGAVLLERDWIGGSVLLTVEERIPTLRFESFGRDRASLTRGFLTSKGEIFQLPGDLGNDYQDLPLLTVETEVETDRISAVSLFEAVDPVLPVTALRVTRISTLISENEVADRSIQVVWGELVEIESKLLVVRKLLDLKENRNATRIDVTNPELPIVSNR
jgi:cell division protein FtsQ